MEEIRQARSEEERICTCKWDQGKFHRRAIPVTETRE